MQTYHICQTKNLPGILKHGLVPLIGPRSAEAKENEPRVYLFPSLDAAEDAMLGWLGETMEDEELTLLEVEASASSLIQNGFELTSSAPIPPENITVKGSI